MENYKVQTPGGSDFETIYAIGDIHGDLNLLLTLLYFCAQVIDENGAWKTEKKKCCVVLVGDTIDRYRPGVFSAGELDGEELLIHLLLNSLDEEAQEHDSRVLKCLGNHEEMNLQGNYSYATTKGKQLRSVFPIKRGSLFSRLIYTDSGTFPFVQLNKKYFFVHGGIAPITEDTVSWLPDACKSMKKMFRNKTKLSKQEKACYELASKMLWDRTYTVKDSCATSGELTQLSKKLQYLQAEMMLSGHTVTVYNGAKKEASFFESCNNEGQIEKCETLTEKEQVNPGIHMSCDQKVVRLDNGASRAFGLPDMDGRKPQIFCVDSRGKYSVLKYSQYNIGKGTVDKIFCKEALRKKMFDYFEKETKIKKIKGGQQKIESGERPLDRYLRRYF